MPAFTINLLSFVIFRPLLTQMANRWIGADRAGFSAIIRKGLLGTLVAFAAVALATYTIGAPALRLVYHTDVSGSMLELMVLVAGGALNAAGVVLYYALTTMRLQKLVFVPAYALLGASLAYAGAMGVLVVVFLMSLFLALRRASSEAPAD